MSFILQATKKADQQSAELLAIDQPDNAMSGSSSRPAINWMAGLSAVISLSAIAFFAVHQTDNTDRAIAEQNKIAASLSSSSNVVEQNSALTEPVTTKLPSQESTFSDLEVVTSVKPKLLNSPESTAAVEKFSTRQVVAIDKDEVQAEGIVREEVGLEAVGLDEVKGKEIADNVATKQKTIEVRSIAEITVDADDEEATNLRLKEERPADELLVQELLTKRTVKSKTEDESSEDDTNDGVVGDLQDTDAVAIAAGSSELSSELDETIIRTVSPTLVDITSSQTPNTSATDFQSVESNSVLSTLQTDTVAMIDGEDGDQPQPPQVDDGKDVEKAKLLALGTDAPVPVLETVQAPAFDSAIAETAVLDDPSIIRELAIDDPDLPLRIRAKIPNIRITKHIYSSAAYMRQVSINNRSLREKDSFTEDILISEITKVGAILAVDNYRISIRRGQDWRRQLAGN